MKIISVIKDGSVIDKILAHLKYKFEPPPLAGARPPPVLPKTVATLSLCPHTTLCLVPSCVPGPVCSLCIGNFAVRQEFPIHLVLIACTCTDFHEPGGMSKKSNFL